MIDMHGRQADGGDLSRTKEPIEPFNIDRLT